MMKIITVIVNLEGTRYDLRKKQYNTGNLHTVVSVKTTYLGLFNISLSLW